MNRLRNFSILSMLCMISTLAIASVCAAEGLNLGKDWLPEKSEWAPDVSLSNTFMTKYIWRGQNLGDEPVMQVDASLSKWGLTFDIWGNYSLNNDKTIDGGRYQEFTELDYTMDYTFNVGETMDKLGMGAPDMLSPLSVSSGYIYYTFPNADWDTDGFDSHEVYMGLSYDTLLNPSLTWYQDIDSGSGSYYLAGIGHTFDFEGGISLDLGMTAAYNYHQWTDQSGWSDMVLSSGISVPFLNYFTFTPNVAYSIVLDRDTYNGAQENEFYGGFTIGFSY